MAGERTGEPWPAYNGFSDAEPSPAPAPRPRRWGRLLAIGAAGAIVLGVGFALLIRPDMSDSGQTANVAASLPIVVAKPPATPVPSESKLNVLPPEVAAQAQAEQQAQAEAQAQTQAQDQAQQAASSSDGGLPAIVGPPPAAPATPSPAVRTSPLAVNPPSTGRDRAGDCAAAGGPAEQLICQDPDLAATDRALSRAYRRALFAGADPRALRADQRDFMAIREDAASRSPRALASVMAQRIDELDAIADRARDGADDGGDEGPGY